MRQQKHSLNDGPVLVAIRQALKSAHAAYRLEQQQLQSAWPDKKWRQDWDCKQ